MKKQKQLSSQAIAIYEYMERFGNITYHIACSMTGLCSRDVREQISELKKVYPIIECVQGWKIADNIAEVQHQMAKYESKKRVYTAQQAPLIIYAKEHFLLDKAE